MTAEFVPPGSPSPKASARPRPAGGEGQIRHRSTPNWAGRVPEALWWGNFRDLAGSVTRMATFATSGRIREEAVWAEIARLRALWRPPLAAQPDKLLRDLLGADALDEIDPFDRPQLAEAVPVCRQSPGLSTAGRAPFAASRRPKKSSNGADRLRKYLARLGLDWDQVRSTPEDG